MGRGKRKESFLDLKIDEFREWSHADEGRSAYFQFMLVDAPIELLKKYVPGIDEETFKYTAVPPRQESQWTTEYIQSFKDMSIPERKKFLNNLHKNQFQDFEVFRKNLAPSIRD